MPLDQFLDRMEQPERSIAVLNRTEPEPLQVMIEKLFDEQAVSVLEGNSDEYDEDTVVLLEDGEVLAQSRLKELQDAILMVNSDLFITGTRSLENTEVPAVLDGLSGTPFSLHGYPKSDTEKLLLILISRYIEKRAFEEGDGTLRSSFQRLSRLDDEQGTRRVYERLAETAVDVHVYGVPNWYPPEELSVIVHGGYNFDFRSSWFVIHDPPADGEYDPAALLAIEREPGLWDGFWTYRRDVVEELTGYIEANL